MKTYWGIVGTAPRILYLGTSWGQLYAPAALLQGKELSVPIG
jgi:hypothetical protein